jgi:penicillin-binding protein 1A
MASRRRKRNARHTGRPVLRIAALLLGVLVVAGLAAGAVGAVWVVDVVNNTPEIDQLKPKPQGAISTIYAADGTRLGFISSDVLRKSVPSAAIADEVKKATIDIEDKRFYDHGGVDWTGVFRAAVKNVTSDSAEQGGSTLTMQLVRNLYTPDTRFKKTLERKIREAKLADELEQIHSKKWILDQYLNNVPYGTVGGQTAVGIEAAARVFYDKRASQLTLSEAALLAGLPQAPTDDNPFNHPAAAKHRRNEVLRAMLEQGDITPAQARAAMDAPRGVQTNSDYSQRRDRRRGQEGDRRHRGQALLRARRRRLDRRLPRRRQERHERQRRAGRLDVDHAARPQPVHARHPLQEDAGAQDPRGQAGRRA